VDKNLQKVLNVSQELFKQGLCVEQQAITLSVFLKMSTGKKFEV